MTMAPIAIKQLQHMAHLSFLTVLSAFAKMFALPRAARPRILLFLLQINVAPAWKVEKHVEMKMIIMRHVIYWIRGIRVYCINRDTLYQVFLSVLC